MDTEQVLHMNHGMGDNSYANNSMMQRKVMMEAKPIVEESMMRLYSIIHPQCLRVVDLGCSSGPNTLRMVSNVIDIIDSTNHNLNIKPPIFQFFLNDLFRNDFNNIFKLLPQFLETLEQKKGNKIGSCFINATPGTFYKRLFPDDYLHFVHSNFSLNWLSQVPRKLVNKESIHVTSTSPPSMRRAYLEQFQRDFKLFLKLRSQELVPGGGMVLTLYSREETRHMRTAWRLFGIILNDMVLENLIEEIKLESFNLPLYDPTMEEVKEVIEEEGSFTLQRLESVIVGYDEGVDIDMRAEIITKQQRVALEPLFKTQFGEHVMDELFLRFKNKVLQLIMEAKILLEFPTLMISLIKNA